MAPSATCPICSAPLALTPHGEFHAWVCPEGHGLAATLSEVYERAQEDDLQHLWQLARAAVPASPARACPMCAGAMVHVVAPLDADEVPEGAPGDGPATASVPIDVCLADQVLWFDDGELEVMPADLPEPELTAEQAAAIAQIARTFGEGLVAAADAREGVTDRLADRIHALVRPATPIEG